MSLTLRHQFITLLGHSGQKCKLPTNFTNQYFFCFSVHRSLKQLKQKKQAFSYFEDSNPLNAILITNHCCFFYEKKELDQSWICQTLVYITIIKYNNPFCNV